MRRRRVTLRIPVPEPGEFGVSAAVGLAGGLLTAAAYMYGRSRGEMWGWHRGHDAGLETGRLVERRWPHTGRP